ncbi:hypothetical protein P8452_69733 [Trifolium repens]|nr:hypothetical protein P8452_69733 [Trifolium repens]
MKQAGVESMKQALANDKKVLDNGQPRVALNRVAFFVPHLSQISSSAFALSRFHRLRTELRRHFSFSSLSLTSHDASSCLISLRMQEE